MSFLCSKRLLSSSLSQVLFGQLVNYDEVYKLRKKFLSCVVKMQIGWHGCWLFWNLCDDYLRVCLIVFLT